MYAVVSQGVEEYGQGGDERLTFTRGHFGYLAFMQHDAAEELHVVVYHVPRDLVAACLPVVGVDGLVVLDADKILGGGQLTVEVGGCNHDFLVLREAACRVLHDGKGRGQHLVQRFLIDIEYFLFQLVYLVEEFFTVLQLGAFHLCFQFVHFGPLFGGRLADISLQFLRLGTQGVVVQLLYFRINGFHLVHPRLNLFHVTRGLVAENRA